MNLEIDRASPIPYYHQIEAQLRAWIESRALRAGAALPGEMEICRMAGVSRMTARQALGLLASKGLVVREAGRGTFVTAGRKKGPGRAEPEQGFLPPAGVEMEMRLLSQGVLPAPEGIAMRLRLEPGEPVVRIARLRLEAGETHSLETAFLPPGRFPGLGRVDPGSASILRLLEEQPGEAPAYVDDLLEILSAGTYEAGILGIEPGAPLARVTSTACLADDTPLACIQTVVPGGRFRAVRRQDQP